MPIYDEIWDEEDFMFRHQLNLRTLPRNHLKMLSTLKFDFVEYKSNQLLACHLYDRMTQHCNNQFGLFEDSYRTECLDERIGYGLAKKYFPDIQQQQILWIQKVNNKYKCEAPNKNKLSNHKIQRIRFQEALQIWISMMITNERIVEYYIWFRFIPVIKDQLHKKIIYSSYKEVFGVLFKSNQILDSNEYQKTNQ